jgi:fructokinase
VTAVKLCGIGEALFDCFADRQVLGGAPLNATAAAHQLGKLWPVDATMISRVGDDELGQQLRRELQRRGMSDQFVQTDCEQATGKVLVELKNGEPEYTILQPAAWDFLTWDDRLETLANTCEGMIFGTLAQRHPLARQTIQQFAATAKQAVRLLDVNLRQEFFSAEILQSSLRLATSVKLNQEELSALANLLQLPGLMPERALIETYNLEAVILTQGAKGTKFISSDGEQFTAPIPRFVPEAQADPVGAGDACAATCLLGLASGWHPQKIVARANVLGAYVASRAGATPEIPIRDLICDP